MQNHTYWNKKTLCSIENAIIQVVYKQVKIHLINKTHAELVTNASQFKLA